MWDEEKFFKDFVQESDRIKPDLEFVDRMTDLVNEEKTKSVWKMGYRVLATAAILVIVCIAGIHFVPEIITDDPAQKAPELQAGDAQTEQSGEGQFGSIGELLDPELEEVKNMLADENCVVTDETGAILSADEKKALATQIDKAKRYDEELVEGDLVRYWIGEDKIVIEIVDDMYLRLEDGEKIYKIK